jgi:hypothetical protein
MVLAANQLLRKLTEQQSHFTDFDVGTDMGCGVGMYPLVVETSTRLAMNGSCPSSLDESRGTYWAL